MHGIEQIQQKVDVSRFGMFGDSVLIDEGVNCEGVSLNASFQCQQLGLFLMRHAGKVIADL
jgi:hypothetical protein